jgi:hypothetical protein
MKCALVLIAACGGVPTLPETQPAHPTTRTQPSCPDSPALGDRSMLTIKPKPGFVISEPQTCNGESYIRIERLAGARPLDTRRGRGGGFNQGCLDVTNPEACLSLNANAVMTKVLVDQRAGHLEITGDGAGPCHGNIEDGYDAWNMAIAVHDWKDADRLVWAMMAELDRDDAKGYVGVAITAIHCSVEL